MMMIRKIHNLVLSPGSLSMYAENCDKSVLKRLLKQLWRIVMKSLERNIVLPPIETKVIRDNEKQWRLIMYVFSFQQKGLEKGLSGMDNVAGGLIGGLMGGGKPDVKNVMNVVSVRILFITSPKNLFH